MKSDAVPSVFSFRKPQTKYESARDLRMKIKEERDQEKENSSNISNFDIQYEVEIECSSVSSDKTPTEEESDNISQHDQGIQCELLSKFSVENFHDNPKAIQYYTGFTDFNHFMFFFHCLGPAAFNRNNQFSSLPHIDQLFLTLMKLRQAKDDIELSFFFNISESTVSRIVTTWINFLYFQLKEITIWPSRELIDKYMPADFKHKFPSTRVILDATEIPIQKPLDVNGQSITWSSYKHKNTVKTMVGCTPKGVVSYVSPSYGGSASDRQIIERSELLDPTNKLFDSGDSVMADRGLTVQDLFANQNVHVNTPTMLKGKTQLESHEVIHDRRVASKRIHIERVIGVSKRYKILKSDLPPSKLPLSSRIFFVCVVLLNFKNSIVDKFA